MSDIFLMANAADSDNFGLFKNCDNNSKQWLSTSNFLLSWQAERTCISLRQFSKTSGHLWGFLMISVENR